MGSYHVVVLSGLANITETIAWRAAGALSGLRVSLDSLANVALGNGRALHYILAEQGGVCAVINSCCTWINDTGQVEVDICEIYNRAK